MGSGVGEADATRSLAIQDSCEPGKSLGAHRERSGSLSQQSGRRLRRAAQRDDRQVLPPGEELNMQFQSCARLATHQRPRSGTRRTARPFRPRFIARSAHCWKAPMVDFLRRAASERRVRPRLVVPAAKERKLAPEVLGGAAEPGSANGCQIA